MLVHPNIGRVEGNEGAEAHELTRWDSIQTAARRTRVMKGSPMPSSSSKYARMVMEKCLRLRSKRRWRLRYVGICEELGKQRGVYGSGTGWNRKASFDTTDMMLVWCLFSVVTGCNLLKEKSCQRCRPVFWPAFSERRKPTKRKGDISRIIYRWNK